MGRVGAAGMEEGPWAGAEQSLEALGAFVTLGIAPRTQYKHWHCPRARYPQLSSGGGHPVLGCCALSTICSGLQPPLALTAPFL